MKTTKLSPFKKLINTSVNDRTVDCVYTGYITFLDTHQIVVEVDIDYSRKPTVHREGVLDKYKFSPKDQNLLKIGIPIVALFGSGKYIKYFIPKKPRIFRPFQNTKPRIETTTQIKT